MDQNQQRVIITAGASGIGLAIAQKFLEQNAQVFICDVAEDILEKTLSENQGFQGSLTDVGNPQQVEVFFAEAIEAMGGVDVLVNNAGIGGPRSSVENIDYSDWDECIRINLSGMFYCAKQVIPFMKEKGRAATSITRLREICAVTSLLKLLFTVYCLQY